MIGGNVVRTSSQSRWLACEPGVEIGLRLNRVEPPHAAMSEAAQLRACDLLFAGPGRRNHRRCSMPGIASCLAHDDRPAHGQIQTIVRPHVVARRRIADVEAKRIVRSNQIEANAAKHAVSAGILNVPKGTGWPG